MNQSAIWPACQVMARPRAFRRCTVGNSVRCSGYRARTGVIKSRGLPRMLMCYMISAHATCTWQGFCSALQRMTDPVAQPGLFLELSMEPTNAYYKFLKLRTSAQSTYARPMAYTMHTCMKQTRIHKAPFLDMLDFCKLRVLHWAICPDRSTMALRSLDSLVHRLLLLQAPKAGVQLGHHATTRTFQGNRESCEGVQCHCLLFGLQTFRWRASGQAQLPLTVPCRPSSSW